MVFLLLAGGANVVARPRVDTAAKPKPAAPAKKPTVAKKPVVPKKTVTAKKRVVRKRAPKAQAAPTRDRIIEIQQALASAGSYQGTPTGKWDTASTQAMTSFQSAHGLAPTGKINALTLDKLGLGAETAGRGAPIARAPAQTAGSDSAATP